MPKKQQNKLFLITLKEINPESFDTSLEAMRIKEIPIPHINLYLPQDEVNESVQRLYRDSVLPTAYINREKQKV